MNFRRVGRGLPGDDLLDDLGGLDHNLACNLSQREVDATSESRIRAMQSP